MVGYHGESSRPYIQRQSAVAGSGTHTFRPRRAGQVGRGRVATNNQIEVDHRCGRVGEIVDPWSQVDNRHVAHRDQRLFRFADLQTV